MIRCQEEPPEDAREDGQAANSTDEENQLKRTSSPSRPRTSGPWSVSISNNQAGQVYRARTSGVPPGNPTPRARNYRSSSLQPGHPATWPGHPAPPEAPDIRPDGETSGPACLRIVKGRSPCTPSFHPLLHLDYKYTSS